MNHNVEQENRQGELSLEFLTTAGSGLREIARQATERLRNAFMLGAMALPAVAMENVAPDRIEGTNPGLAQPLKSRTSEISVKRGNELILTVKYDLYQSGELIQSDNPLALVRPIVAFESTSPSAFVKGGAATRATYNPEAALSLVREDIEHKISTGELAGIDLSKLKIQYYDADPLTTSLEIQGVEVQSSSGTDNNNTKVLEAQFPPPNNEISTAELLKQLEEFDIQPTLQVEFGISSILTQQGALISSFGTNVMQSAARRLDNLLRVYNGEVFITESALREVVASAGIDAQNVVKTTDRSLLQDLLNGKSFTLSAANNLIANQLLRLASEAELGKLSYVEPTKLSEVDTVGSSSGEVSGSENLTSDSKTTNKQTGVGLGGAVPVGPALITGSVDHTWGSTKQNTNAERVYKIVDRRNNQASTDSRDGNAPGEISRKEGEKEGGEFYANHRESYLVGNSVPLQWALRVTSTEMGISMQELVPLIDNTKEELARQVDTEIRLQAAINTTRRIKTLEDSVTEALTHDSWLLVQSKMLKEYTSGATVVGASDVIQTLKGDGGDSESYLSRLERLNSDLTQLRSLELNRASTVTELRQWLQLSHGNGDSSWTKGTFTIAVEGGNKNESISHMVELERSRYTESDAWVKGPNEVTRDKSQAEMLALPVKFKDRPYLVFNGHVDQRFQLDAGSQFNGRVSLTISWDDIEREWKRLRAEGKPLDKPFVLRNVRATYDLNQERPDRGFDREFVGHFEIVIYPELATVGLRTIN